MADELLQPAAEAPAPAPEAPAPDLASAITAAEAGAPAVAPAGPVAPAAPATPSDGWQGVRDYARSQGLELPYQDDVAALQGLLGAYRQGQQRDFYSDLGRRVAPHAQEFTSFIQQRQPPAQAPAPWSPPPFKKEWLQQVERDEATGLLRAKPGCDPGLVEKVQAYAEWRDRFLDSPEQVIAPLAEERARQIVRQEMGQYQQQVTADQLIAQSPWMFAADGQGLPVQNQNGQRQLSPAGQLYAQSATDLWSRGLRDVRQVHQLARQTVENAVLRQQLIALQPAPAPSGPALSPTSVGGGVTRPAANAPPAAATSQKGLSLRERLAVNLNGFPEEAAVG